MKKINKKEKEFWCNVIDYLSDLFIEHNKENNQKEEKEKINCTNVNGLSC